MYRSLCFSSSVLLAESSNTGDVIFVRYVAVYLGNWADVSSGILKLIWKHLHKTRVVSVAIYTYILIVVLVTAEPTSPTSDAQTGASV
jgi:hypothetical protein